MSRRGAARLGWGLAAFSLALSLVGEGLWREPDGLAVRRSQRASAGERAMTGDAVSVIDSEAVSVIDDRYAKLGGPTGFLGRALSDEAATSDGRGRSSWSARRWSRR